MHDRLSILGVLLYWVANTIAIGLLLLGLFAGYSHFFHYPMLGDAITLCAGAVAMFVVGRIFRNALAGRPRPPHSN